jgi:hypothetical protein
MSKTRKAGFDETEETNDSPTVIGKSFMLGIGINQYHNPEWPRLNNAVNDIKKVAALLQKRYRFDEITLLKDNEVTRDSMEEALYRYTDEAVLGPNDSLLIYYSGHGFRDKNDKGFWVPVDAKKGRIASYLPNSIILDHISSMKARHVLLVSDSCYSGTLFSQNRNGRNIEHVATELEKYKSRWAICSGREDQKVSDGDNGVSPFTEALLQELEVNSLGKVNISRIAERVMDITGGGNDQLPQAGPIKGDLGGQFVFTLKNYDPQKEPKPTETEERPGPTRSHREPEPQDDEPVIPPTPPAPPQPTTRKELYDAIQQLLVQQFTLESIQLILDYNDPGLARVRETAVLLSGRWNALQREDRQGTIDNKEFSTGKNKITQSVQELAKDIYKPSTVSELTLLQNTLRTHIGMARTDEAIKTMRNLTIPEWTDDMRLMLNAISSEWETLKREEILGIADDASKRRNKVTVNLLSLIDRLKPS